jgi:Protein of unknown function (DUF3237)
MLDYRLEHVFSYTARLKEPEVIGPLREGLRMNFYVTDGEISCPKLRGKLHPVGGDWFTLRTDGVAILDVRATLEAHDGALIYATYNGVIDMGPDGYQKFLQGQSPSGHPSIHIAPRFHTTHANYLWLNRLQCLGIGQAMLERREVQYDISAVR